MVFHFSVPKFVDERSSRCLIFVLSRFSILFLLHKNARCTLRYTFKMHDVQEFCTSVRSIWRTSETTNFKKYPIVTTETITIFSEIQYMEATFLRSLAFPRPCLSPFAGLLLVCSAKPSYQDHMPEWGHPKVREKD